MVRGFTLIEIVVVIALMIAVGGWTIVSGIDDLRRTNARSTHEQFTTTLLHARAQAAANKCFGGDCTQGRAHGVAIVGNTLVVFQSPTSTPTYAMRDSAQDEIVQLDASTTASGATEVSFMPFSVVATTTGNIIEGDELWHTDIVLTDATGKSATTTIYANGRIDR